MRSGYLIINNEIIPWQTIAGNPDAYLLVSRHPLARPAGTDP